MGLFNFLSRKHNKNEKPLNESAISKEELTNEDKKYHDIDDYGCCTICNEGCDTSTNRCHNSRLNAEDSCADDCADTCENFNDCCSGNCSDSCENFDNGCSSNKNTN